MTDRFNDEASCLVGRIVSDLVTVVRGRRRHHPETFRTRSLGRLTIRAYWLAGTPSVKRAADLSGRRVITILGYQYAGMEAIAALDRSGERFSARSHRDGLAMLTQGHGDYLLDYEQPENASQTDLNVRTIESAELFGTAVVIYVSRRATGGAGLCQTLDKAAQEYLTDQRRRGRASRGTVAAQTWPLIE